jgi:filamentous hemagglutinin
MSQDALDYQNSLPGSISDTKSQKMLAPGLRYDNPNPRGKNYILFDGLDLYDSKTLVDRKLGIARSKKQEKSFGRWAEGLRQNPDFKIRIEAPNERVRRQVDDFLRILKLEETVFNRIQVVEVPN